LPTIVPARPPLEAMTAPERLALEVCERYAGRNPFALAGSRAPSTMPAITPLDAADSRAPPLRTAGARSPGAWL
jgi:hypothetical protein